MHLESFHGHCLVLCAGCRCYRIDAGYEPFGKFALYAQSDNQKHVVLFGSGDGGWNLGVIDMARALATLDALVVGVGRLWSAMQSRLLKWMKAKYRISTRQPQHRLTLARQENPQLFAHWYLLRASHG